MTLANSAPSNSGSDGSRDGDNEDDGNVVTGDGDQFFREDCELL